MERTAVNPVQWSGPMGFDQGVLVTGATRTLHVSGQTAMDADGVPQHPGDLAAQLALTLSTTSSPCSTARA